MQMAYPSPKLNRASGRWRFRKVVPTAVRSRLGKTEIVRWLGTDRDEARRRNAELHAEWEARFAALASGITVLSRKQALALAGRWYEWFVARHDDDAGTTPEGWELSLEALQALEATAGLLDERDISPLDERPRGPKATQRVHAFLHDRGHLTQFFLDEGVTLAPASLPMFMEAMEDQFYAAHQRLMQLARGDYSPDERLARLPVWEHAAPVSKPSSAVASGETLTLPMLFERWKEANPAIKHGTLKVYDPPITKLDAFIEGRSARDITEDDIWRWVQHLQDVGGIGPKTIRDSYLTALKSVMGWAASYPGGRLLAVNPAANVKLKVPKTGRARQPNFRTDESKAILSAALAVADDPKYPARAAARRWVPWLCAYTGARVQEMTQLRGCDIRQEDGVWVLDIVPEAGTVKSGQSRRAFLHEHLVEQGFPAFATSRGVGPLFYDPARRRKADAKASQAELAAKDIGLWVQETVGLDPRLQPNHAWRHTLKTLLQLARVEESIRDVLVGHTVKGVARTYEHASPAVLVAELNKVPRYETD